MSKASGELIIARHDGVRLRAMKDELLSVYKEVYAERLDNPFFHPDRFWERLEGYSSREGFRLVTGRIDGDLIGFTLGSPLAADSRWWNGFKGDIDPDVLVETGTRTFGINELQVRPAWRRRGHARALSAALLDGRPEERATLLVRADNVAAFAAYPSWGFKTIGQVQPFADSPLYESMVKELG